VLALLAADASAIDAETILRRAETVRSPDLDYAVDFRLEVIDPDSLWKQRTAAYTLIAHGKDHSLVVMREPLQFYPGTLLIDDGLYWLLLPRSTRPFQLSPRHVLDGDIANGDLARGNLLSHYAPSLEGEETVRDLPCYRLRLARRSERAMYPEIRVWITKDGLRPHRFDYYGETGALLKTAYYRDYTEGPLGVRAMRVEVENRARPGERSVLIFSDLRPFDAAGWDFSREALPAVRDAFLAGHAAAGRQVRPEEARRFLGLGAP
jgi:hypothetical protein